MRKIKGIILHASATRPAWMKDNTLAEQVAEIKHWHVDDNGWNDIGYHFLIGRAGGRARGRPIEIDGAGVYGHNKGIIHICLIGGHGSAATDKFHQHFTEAQDAEVRRLIAELRRDYGDDLPVTGHNEYDNKACPGFNVHEWMASNETYDPEVDEATLYRWRLKAIMDFANEALDTAGRTKG